MSALAVAVLAAAGVATLAWLDIREQTDRAVAATLGTRDELARARAELAAAVERLEADRATLRGQRAELAAREADRDAADERLSDAEGRLAERQAGLGTAQTDLEERQARLDALDRCLRGAVEGLNQASIGDTDGVEATLGRVGDSCAAAGAAP